MLRIARAVRGAIKQQQLERQPVTPYVTYRTPNSLEVEWVVTENDKMFPAILQVCEPQTLAWRNVYRGNGCKCSVISLVAGTLYKLRLRVDKSDEEENWGPVITAQTREDVPSMDSLHRAIQYGYVQDVLKILKARPSASENSHNGLGLTPVQLAVLQGDRKLVETLLSHCPSTLEEPSIGGAYRTPLMIACGSGNSEQVRLLADRGARWDTADRNGVTALHYATDASHLDAMQIAIEHKADIDAQDCCGWTPLFRGVLLGSSIEVLELLVENKSDVNHRDKDGVSVLTAAILESRKDIITLLKTHGADVNMAGDSHGTTPLQIALHLGNEDVIDILSPAVATVSYSPAVVVSVEDSEEENA